MAPDPSAKPQPLVAAVRGDLAVPPAPRPLSSEAELLKALQRRWLLASTVGLLLAGLVAVPVWYLLPSKFVARAVVHFATNPPSFPGSSPDRPLDLVNYQRTQKLLVKSRYVLNAALKDPGIAGLQVLKEQIDPLEWLDRMVVVDFPAPGVMGIALQGNEPKELEKIVNAIVNTYQREVLKKEQKQQAQLLDRLGRALDDYQEKLRDVRKTYQALARQAGSSDPQNLGFKYRLALEQLMMAESDLRQVKFDLMKLDAEAEASGQFDKKGKAADLPPALVDEELQKHKEVRQLQERKAELQRMIRDTQKTVVRGREGPFVAPYRRELLTLDESLEALRKELRPEVEAQLRKDLFASNQAHGDQLRQEVAVKKALKDRLEALIDRLRKETKGITDYSLDLESLRGQIGQYEEMTKWFSNKIEQLRWEQQAPSRVELLEEAYTARAMDPKKQLLATGLAGLAAFGLGLFGVAWREQRARRIKSGEEVVQRVGLPLIGSLPRLPGQTAEPSAEEAEPAGYGRNSTVEHIDATRARLLYTARVQPFRTLMVTSALAGEGKTSLACHLAASLARAGRKTLLLDCDLRRPSAHRLFDRAAEPGFCEVLRGEADLDAVVVPTFLTNLSLIPGGRWNSQASRALAQEERIGSLLQRLRQQYDFVILDSSPVLAVADSLWLGQHVDAALFAVLYAVSHLPSVQAAHQELAAVGTRVLGAVIGGAPAGASGYQAATYAASYYSR